MQEEEMQMPMPSLECNYKIKEAEEGFEMKLKTTGICRNCHTHNIQGDALPPHSEGSLPTPLKK